MLKLRTPMCGDHRPHNDGLFFPLTGYNLQSPIWRWLRVLPPHFFSMSPQKQTISKGKVPVPAFFMGIFKLQGRSHLGCGWRRSGGGFRGTENAHFHGANLGPGSLGSWEVGFCCPTCQRGKKSGDKKLWRTEDKDMFSMLMRLCLGAMPGRESVFSYKGSSKKVGSQRGARHVEDSNL